MTIKKVEKGWKVDIQPGGRAGRRVSKTLPTKGEAMAWEAWAKTKAAQTPEWAPNRMDTRQLSKLIEAWWTAIGAHQRAGENTKQRLENVVRSLGDPAACQLSASSFSAYRTRRIAEGISKNTLNREHAYLKSAIEHLKRLGEWRGENPLTSVKPFKIEQTELAYLTDDQVDALLDALSKSSNKSALPCCKLALATGLRWREAELVERNQLRDGRVTVAGKNFKNRSLPICAELAHEILEQHEPEATGKRLFADCYGAFRSGVERAGLELPDGQLAHVTRHTFASRFIQQGGNILVLQRALDHSDLKVTMRYAHLAPDHLDQVMTLNPLARLYPASTQPQPRSAKGTLGTVQPGP